jgi:hypothetical protein
MKFTINLQIPLNLNGMLPMPLPRLDRRQSHPVERISTIKIVVKASGRRLSDLPKNLSEVLLEAKVSNKKDVINRRKDKLRVLLDKLPTGFRARLIVFAEGKLYYL